MKKLIITDDNNQAICGNCGLFLDDPKDAECPICDAVFDEDSFTCKAECIMDVFPELKEK